MMILIYIISYCTIIIIIIICIEYIVPCTLYNVLYICARYFRVTFLCVLLLVFDSFSVVLAAGANALFELTSQSINVFIHLIICYGCE